MVVREYFSHFSISVGQDPPPRRAHFVKKTPLQRKQGVKRKRPDTVAPKAPKDFPTWSGSGYMTRSRRARQCEGNLKVACMFCSLLQTTESRFLIAKRNLF